GDLTDGIGRAGCDEQQHGLPALPAVEDVLHQAGDPGDCRPPRRVGPGGGGDDPGCCLRQHRLHRRPPAAQGVSEFHRLDGRDAPRHGKHHCFSRKRLHDIVTSWTMCHACGPYFFTRREVTAAENPASSTRSRIVSFTSPMLWMWSTLPSRTWARTSPSIDGASKCPIRIRS